MDVCRLLILKISWPVSECSEWKGPRYQREALFFFLTFNTGQEYLCLFRHTLIQHSHQRLPFMAVYLKVNVGMQFTVLHKDHSWFFPTLLILVAFWHSTHNQPTRINLSFKNKNSLSIVFFFYCFSSFQTVFVKWYCV